ncbi:Cellulose synthase operon protein C [Pseudomonas savastanoi pv. fraxini]|nr:Cellulose synthase operon protein C [Pseudomonas savastanoi pv. fraxini]
MGQTGAATELLRKAVAIEQSEKQRVMAAQAVPTSITSSNPFAAGGSRSLAAASAIPAPAQVSLSGGRALETSNALETSAPRDTAYPGQIAAQQPLSAARAQSVSWQPPTAIRPAARSRRSIVFLSSAVASSVRA